MVYIDFATRVAATFFAAVIVRLIWAYHIPEWCKRLLRALPGRRNIGSKNKLASSAQNLSSSPTVILDRLFDIFEKAAKKVKAPIGSWQLRAALIVLIRCRSSDEINEHVRAHVDETVDERHARPSKKEMESSLFWLDMAETAYEPSTTRIRDKLEQLNYKLLRHDLAYEPGAVGYFVAFSPTEKMVVVSIKGTSSFSDAMTDCMGATVPHKFLPHCPFDEDDGGREVRCHDGILAAAINVSGDVGPIIEHFALPLNYSVTICGHSLGAGTASILSILLRARFLALHEPGALAAWAFAPPPVFDCRTAELSSSFVTTFVNKSDIVPRASLSNLEIFFKHVALVVKYFESNGIPVNSWKSVSTILTMQQSGELAKILPIDQALRLLEVARSGVVLDDKDHLYVPGRLIHLYDKKMAPFALKESDAEFTTSACIIDVTHEFLRSIPFTSDTLFHHSLDSYKNGITSAVL